MSEEIPSNDAAETPAPAGATPEPVANDATAPTAPTTPMAAPAEADAVPTQPDVPVAAAPAAGVAGPAATPVAAAPPARSTHVAVPKWVLTTVAAVIGALVMFGIGYAVGDGSNGNDTTAVAPIGNQNPFGGNTTPGNGNPQLPGFPDRGNGNPGNGPQSPSPQRSGAFLGVATQQTTGGLEVVQVVPGSAAGDAGLKDGDVIVEFDGDTVTTPAQLAAAVANADVGDEVKITYERNGQSTTVSVELGSRSSTSN